MVKGLNEFREHFKEHSSAFVIIGGTACSLLFDEAGIEFRATRDIDIVLLSDKPDEKFAGTFWKFIKKGRYSNLQKSTGKSIYYRFYDPEIEDFPYMLEIFFCVKGFEDPNISDALVPVPFEYSSDLSAIMLNSDYYKFLTDGIIECDGLQLAEPARLISLKMKAFLDMTERKKAGDKIDSKDIKKHRNDVFRLYQLLESGMTADVPVSIYNDIILFLELMKNQDIDLKQLGLGQASYPDVIEALKETYRKQ